MWSNDQVKVIMVGSSDAHIYSIRLLTGSPLFFFLTEIEIAFPNSVNACIPFMHPFLVHFAVYGAMGVLNWRNEMENWKTLNLQIKSSNRKVAVGFKFIKYFIKKSFAGLFTFHREKLSKNTLS